MKENKMLERISYGLSETGSAFSWTLVSTYLTVFYTDVVGLAPAVISMIMLVARVWDAVNDPMMGVIANRTHTKWGSYRPYLLFGAPVLAVTTVLTFTCPGLMGMGKIMYAALTYIACGMAYTVVNICTQALANVMTEDSQERMILITYKGVLSNIGGIVLNAVMMPAILHFGNGDTSNPRGYTYSALIFSIVGTIFLIISFAGTKEKLTVSEPQEQAPVKESLSLVFGNADIRRLLIGYLVYMTGLFGRLGVMVYFFIYVLEEPAWMTSTSVCLTLGAAIFSLIAPFFTKRFEKKKIIMGLLFTVFLSGIVISLGGKLHSLPIICLGTLAFQGCGVGTGNVSMALIAEVVDAMEVQTGQRVDGICMSVTSFAVKLGNAVAGSAGILALSLVGFVANEAPSAMTKTNMSIVINIVPGVLCLLAIFFMARINMNREIAAKNTAILDERRKEKE